MRARRVIVILALAVGLIVLGATEPVWAGDVDGDGVDDAMDVCNNTPAGTAVDAEGRPLGDIDRDCATDLEDYALFQQGFTGPLPPVVIDTVPVGNPGNTGELSGAGAGGSGPDRICGAVAYMYNIGKYEVTAGQYTEFLNAVATTDTYGLYDSLMWSDSFGCKIEQTGSSGSYSYSVATDWAGRPVNYISWGDAARFCNWLHNGQPTGMQDLTTTEDGSYSLDGATSDAELLAIAREPDATWVIPSEDEWYKAAYHMNDGVTGNYYDYATSSDSVPSNDLIDPDPGNNATFYGGSSDWTIGSPYWRTEFGAHENSDSPYGTFDQGGNVWEWNEAVLFGLCRGKSGGAFNGLDYYLHAAHRDCDWPTSANNTFGFRVAEVP
ncbi:MAG: SUMF1/EgtB/PvdO family nonheme iron enzyme [Phycisphaerales bacterium]|nr:MAG: SUMF1/EgtB/PvdO family nonheme iron enzyme [Phycisphaerales bacterium]